MQHQGLQELWDQTNGHDAIGRQSVIKSHICFYLFVIVQKSLIYVLFDESESVLIPMKYLNVGLQ